MNREIKFRGKRIDSGEWVEGYYFAEGWMVSGQRGEAHYIKPFVGVKVEVDPKTVGEYTGIKDCNGQEIYEGDVLNFPEAGENVDVIYDEGAFRVLFSFENETAVLTNKMLDANYNVTVRGNIYEDKNLLEATS